MKYLGLFVALFTIIFTLTVSGSVFSFLDIPSLIMVVGITIGLSLFKFQEDALRFWKIQDTTKRSEIATWIGKTCLHVGLFLAVVGFIQIGTYLDDMKTLGPALAVAITPIIYSYFIFFFLTSSHTNFEIN